MSFGSAEILRSQSPCSSSIPAWMPGVEAHEHELLQLDCEVGGRLPRVLGPVLLHLHDLLLQRLRRLAPAEIEKRPLPAALARVHRWSQVGVGAAEERHEPVEPVVPVVVPGDRVDRSGKPPVRPEELVVVVEHVPGGIDDVADDEGEVGVLRRGPERAEHLVLRVVTLAGIAEHHERELVLLRVALDRESGIDPLSPLRLDPALPLVVGRVADPARDLVVPGLPQRPRVDPGELLLLGPPRPVQVGRISFGGAEPTGALPGRAGRDGLGFRARSAGRHRRPLEAVAPRYDASPVPSSWRELGYSAVTYAAVRPPSTRKVAPFT